MIDVELGAVQERFADIVWDNEPIASGELVKLCEKELRWKKPTTYTVLRKLCEKGLLKNENGIVTSLISKEDFYSAKSEQIVVDSYRGSLPAFIAAFISRKEISAEEAEEIGTMYKEMNDFIVGSTAKMIRDNNVDEAWDSYVSAMNTQYLPTWLQINQAAYDRYMGK